MGQAAISVFSWTVKIGFLMAMVTAYIALLNIVILLLDVGINPTVLGDLTALIQMWLPFNLNAIFWWFTTIINAYIVYRLTMAAYAYINSFLGNR